MKIAALPLALATAALATLAWPVLTAPPAHAETARALPRPAIDQAAAKGNHTAIFAGGCFWGMEAVFEQMKGVKSVTSGYAGGTATTATYQQVSSERTGHAEAIRIVYDPRQVSYGTLLRVFFAVAHDPTQLNRQGPDSGPSYRSAIFPQSPEQSRIAAAYVKQLGGARAFAAPIVTRIEAGRFYPAEAYHQDFMRRNPTHPYIMRWDKPKVAAFRAGFPTLAR
jgi:peptide-methionine (S)-S-oxide reductase